jgi:hypothetical protein
MKALLLSLLIVTAPVCQAQTSSRERDTLMKTFEETTRPSAVRAMTSSFGGINRMLDADKKENPGTAPEKWAEVSKEYEAEAERILGQPGGLPSLIAREVATNLSNDELQEVIAFLNSSAGQKYTNSSERMRTLISSGQARAIFASSMLQLYAAKVSILGNKHGLKVAPMPLQAR